MIKCTRAEPCQIFAVSNACKVGSALKCTVANFGHAVRYGKGRQGRAVEHLNWNFRHRCPAFKRNGRHGAVAEDGTPQRGDGRGNGNRRGEVFGSLKRRLLHHGQVGAARKRDGRDGRIGKRLRADKLHRGGNGNACQRGMVEPASLNGDQRFGQSDALHRCIGKRTAADGGDVAAKLHGGKVELRSRSEVFENGDVAACQLCVAIVAACGNACHAEIVALDASVPILVKIERQSLGGKVHFQPSACLQECIGADVLRAFGNSNGCQAVATVECISANVLHTVRNGEGGQTLAEAAGKVVDFRQLRVAEINGGQLGHALKAMRLDGGQRRAVFKFDGLQVGRAIKHICADGFQLAVCGKDHACQLCTALKRALCNGGNALWNGDRGNAAICERAVADTRQHAVFTECDCRHRHVAEERIATDLHHTAWKCHEIQRGHIGKRIFLNVDKAFGEGDRLQMRGPVERRGANRFDALRNLVGCSAVSRRVRNRLFTVLGVDDAVTVAVTGVLRTNENVFKAPAACKRACTEVGQRCRNRHVAVQCGGKECKVAQLCQAARKRNIGKRSGNCKRIRADDIQIAVFPKGHIGKR